MHRCQVKIRHDHDTPDESLLDCGDVASKKIGQIWVCDYHYNRFGVPNLGEDCFDTCTLAVDCDIIAPDKNTWEFKYEMPPTK